MKHVDDNSLVPSRGSGGPLAPWIDAFSDWARQQGYSRSAMSRRVSLATGFDAWLEHEGIDPDHLTSDHPARYLQYRARRQRLYDGDAAALRHLIDFLRLEGALRGWSPPRRHRRVGNPRSSATCWTTSDICGNRVVLPRPRYYVTPSSALRVETTQIYVEATLAMKEQALAKTIPPTGRTGRYRPSDPLLEFLGAL